MRVWDVAARRVAHTPRDHARGVLAVARSSAGDRLARGGEDNRVRLWDPVTGEPWPVLTGHPLWVLSLAFDPAGMVLASGGRDRTVRLWPLDDDREPQVLSGYTNWVSWVQYSPDGRTLATASGHYAIDSSGEVKLCDPEAGYVRAILTGGRAPLAFAPDGRRLLVGVAGGAAELAGP